MNSTMKLFMSLGLTLVATSSAEYCPCFTKEMLESITSDNYHDVMSSCHETHYTGSGIGIYSIETDDHGHLGYHVSLGKYGAPPECVMGSAHMVSGTKNMEQAEICAQLIRDRCAEISHTTVQI